MSTETGDRAGGGGAQHPRRAGASRLAGVSGGLALAFSVYPTALWYASPPLAAVAILVSVRDRRAARNGGRPLPGRGPAVLGVLALLTVAAWVVYLALYGSTTDARVAYTTGEGHEPRVADEEALR